MLIRKWSLRYIQIIKLYLSLDDIKWLKEIENIISLIQNGRKEYFFELYV